jgi:hypothetical protein
MSLEEGLEAALLARRQKAAAAARKQSAPSSNGASTSPHENMDLSSEQRTSVDAMDVDAGSSAAQAKEKDLGVGTAANRSIVAETSGNQAAQSGHVAPSADRLGNGVDAEAYITPEERRVLDWHYANLEYGCAAQLGLVSLPHWNQDDPFGGFGGPHCMVKGGEVDVARLSCLRLMVAPSASYNGLFPELAANLILSGFQRWI